MKGTRLIVRKLNTYNIPPISNSSKVNRAYRESAAKNEDDLYKIFNKELVAYPYAEEKYQKLLHMETTEKKRNLYDFYYNYDMYINVEKEKINSITRSDFFLKNIDKCFLLEKEYLDSFFFEGIAGELPKDIMLHDNGANDDNYEIFLKELKKNNSSDLKKIKNGKPIKGVGLLYRKMAYEIIQELKSCEVTYKWRQKRDSYNLDEYFLEKGDSAFYDKNMDRNTKVKEDCEMKEIFNRRSILIDGKRGTGKSCILNTVVLWAKLNNWFVIFIPDIKKYKFDINTIVRSNTNLYIQPELSRQFLENIVKGNEKFLKELKVSKEIIKNTCLDGTHILYNKRLYDDIIRKTVETEIKQDEQFHALSEKEKNFTKQKLYKFYYDNIKIPNLLDKFALPSNLFELATIGINNSAYSNLCIYALFEHLKKQTKFPILIAVDQFNYNLSVSEYLSIHFENTKYNGYIPTYFLTIPKLLIQWDAQKYKRCFKIAVTCWDRENRRNFQPQLLGIQKQEVKTVRNFTLREFKNYICHLFNQNIIYNFDINKLEYFYMLTGGNGFQARKLLTTLY